MVVKWRLDMKNKYFEKEMIQLDLIETQKAYLRERMQDGLEIMTKAEIKQTIEDYINFDGLLLK